MIQSTVQSVVHFCETVKVTDSPSKLLMVTGFSKYGVAPSELVSTAPITQISVGVELGAELGDKLGSEEGTELGKELGELVGAILGATLGPELGESLGELVGTTLG